MRIRSYLNYLKQVALWFWRGKYHVLTFSAMIITILYIVGAINFYPNIVSTILSITGLTIILALQMLDAREFSDHKPSTIQNWLKSFPKRKPIVATVKGVGIVALTGKVTAIGSVSDDATIEDKIAFLLRQVNNIQKTIGNLDGRIDELASSQTNVLKGLKTDLDQLNASLNITIAGHIVGDYDINLFGIIITICGTLIQFFNS